MALYYLPDYSGSELRKGYKMLLGALEGGGTKMVLAVGEEDGTVIDRISIPTKTPQETMPAIIEYFKAHMICALGVGFFGPLDLNERSKTFGCVTESTKEDWTYFNVLQKLKDELNVPCKLDTDVNAAALGEATYGCMRKLKNGIYITVGTGIGVGVFANGALVHGLVHPEGGHILVRRHPDDTYEGNCSFHKDCLEGLASGPAIMKRMGARAEELPQDSPVWTYVSYYLAQAICNYIYILSPEKIVLGGGVLHQKQLLPMIRKDVKALLGGYIRSDAIEDMENYIVPASLKDNQAVMGCLKLAYDAALLS